jgi:preprotein translocase subunit SecG
VPRQQKQRERARFNSWFFAFFLLLLLLFLLLLLLQGGGGGGGESEEEGTSSELDGPSAGTADTSNSCQMQTKLYA